MGSRTRTTVTALALLSACAAIVGCNRREKECAAVTSAINTEENDPWPEPLDAGSPLALQQRTERTIAALDAIDVRDKRLAPVVASYRALEVTRAAAARELETEIAAVLVVFQGDAGAAPRPDLEQVKRLLQDVAQPLVVCMIAPGHSADAGAECDALTDMLGRAVKPAPGVSLAAHVLSCASMLDALPTHDARAVAAAHELATMMRAYEPALRHVQMPATEVVARAQHLASTSGRYQQAVEAAKEAAKTIWATCSGP